jgi:hypothetical protein
VTTEEWVEAHTVDGIRPHLPRSPEEDDLQRKLAKQELARTDWREVARRAGLLHGIKES